MGVRVGGFFRCTECDKLHQVSGITRTSVCTCGANLYEMAWQEAKIVDWTPGW